MSVHQYTAGARTRNVVNIADPGGDGTAKAYSLDATNSAPTAATHGYKNYRSQKYLHVLVKSTADQYFDLVFYGYNSSLGGSASPVWSPISIPVRHYDGNTMQFMQAETRIAAGGGTTQFLRFVIPIEGIERIAVKATEGGTVGSGTCDIYLGVNSII